MGEEIGAIGGAPHGWGQRRGKIHGKLFNVEQSDRFQTGKKNLGDS